MWSSEVWNLIFQTGLHLLCFLNHSRNAANWIKFQGHLNRKLILFVSYLHAVTATFIKCNWIIYTIFMLFNSVTIGPKWNEFHYKCGWMSWFLENTSCFLEGKTHFSVEKPKIQGAKWPKSKGGYMYFFFSWTLFLANITLIHSPREVRSHLESFEFISSPIQCIFI